MSETRDERARAQIVSIWVLLVLTMIVNAAQRCSLDGHSTRLSALEARQSEKGGAK